MITGLLIQAALWPVTWLLNLLPSWSLPAGVSDIPATSAQLAGYVGQFSNWLPGEVLAPCLALVTTSFVVAVAVRVGRVVLAHLPFIGGDSGG